MRPEIPRRALRRFQESRTVRRPIRISTWRRCSTAPGVEMAFLEFEQSDPAEQLEDFDALILLAHRFAARERAEERPARRRGALRRRLRHGRRRRPARKAGIALVITPDGVRRPVAVSIITLMLALTGKLMIKDRLTREAAGGFAKRSDHMGVGLVGRTLRLARHRQYRRRECSAWRSRST